MHVLATEEHAAKGTVEVHAISSDGPHLRSIYTPTKLKLRDVIKQRRDEPSGVGTKTKALLGSSSVTESHQSAKRLAKTCYCAPILATVKELLNHCEEPHDT